MTTLILKAVIAANILLILKKQRHSTHLIVVMGIVLNCLGLLVIKKITDFIFTFLINIFGIC